MKYNYAKFQWEKLLNNNFHRSLRDSVFFFRRIAPRLQKKTHVKLLEGKNYKIMRAWTFSLEFELELSTENMFDSHFVFPVSLGTE